MATLDLGKIKPLYKGFYSPITSFEPLDFTIFNGVLFVNKQACTGVEPTDIGYFDPININSTDLLALIKQVDGSGSGLDADTVDGVHGSELQRVIAGAASTITTANLPPLSVVVTDANGKITALQSVSVTELALLDGATFNIQAQLNAKQATIAGAASSVTDTNLAPLMVVVTNADGKIAVSATISDEELSFLEGVTSAIQPQLDSKLGEIDLADYLKKVFISPNTVLVANADSKATSSTVTVAELGHLGGVTSAIQPQLNGKLSTTGKAADSNLLDGMDSSAFSRRLGNLSSTTIDFNTLISHGTYHRPLNTGTITYTNHPTGLTNTSRFTLTVNDASGDDLIQIISVQDGGGTNRMWKRHRQDTVWFPWIEIWTSATGGSGSGLDADLLDGQQGSWYANLGQILGVGQTWQDVTASRAFGVTYTNSTGKPIMLSIMVLTSSGSTDYNLYVNGVAVQFQDGAGASGYIISAVVIVPNGSNYSITGGANFSKWWELR